MATETHTPLVQFVDRIRADDAHAAHHLDLLRQVDGVLSGRIEPADDDRAALAERLQRWRYQWLAERCGRMTHEDRGLVDALDLAANRLARRPCRQPRAARAAIGCHGWLVQPCSTAGQAEGVREFSSEKRGISTTWVAWPRLRGHAQLARNMLTQARACHPQFPDTLGQASSGTPHATPDSRKWLDPETSLDELIDRAARVTADHFGAGGDSITHRRMLLYAPLYLSSFCTNVCQYCGFRFDQPIERKHLGTDEAVGEAEILRRRGFRHVLLVAGDFPRLMRTEYFTQIIARLRQMGITPAIEVAPQPVRAYGRMVAAGLCGVTLYQETYQENLYRRYHPRGTKASFDWRLEGLERAAEAGVKRLGLGVLLGLADPREDVLAMIRHADYLQRRFPDRRLAFSLPRIHDAPPDFQQPYHVDDEQFVRLYCVLRLAFPGANLVLSTREQPALRNRLSGICITQLSAGSCTAPGGYGHERREGQFPVHDHRRVDEVVGWLQNEGFQPVWSFDELEAAFER